MIDVLEKLSILTTIDAKTLSKLCEKASWCICDGLYLESLNNVYRCFFDIGIGTVGIDYSAGDVVRYNFVPSKEFEKSVISTISNGESPLKGKVEQSLVRKITETYKDLF